MGLYDLIRKFSTDGSDDFMREQLVNYIASQYGSTRSSEAPDNPFRPEDNPLSDEAFDKARDKDFKSEAGSRLAALLARGLTGGDVTPMKMPSEVERLMDQRKRRLHRDEKDEKSRMLFDAAKEREYGRLDRQKKEEQDTEYKQGYLDYLRRQEARRQAEKDEKKKVSGGLDKKTWDLMSPLSELGLRRAMEVGKSPSQITARDLLDVGLTKKQAKEVMDEIDKIGVAKAPSYEDPTMGGQVQGPEQMPDGPDENETWELHDLQQQKDSGGQLNPQQEERRRLLLRQYYKSQGYDTSMLDEPEMVPDDMGSVEGASMGTGRTRGLEMPEPGIDPNMPRMETPDVGLQRPTGLDIQQRQTGGGNRISQMLQSLVTGGLPSSTSSGLGQGGKSRAMTPEQVVARREAEGPVKAMQKMDEKVVGEALDKLSSLPSLLQEVKNLHGSIAGADAKAGAPGEGDIPGQGLTGFLADKSPFKVGEYLLSDEALKHRGALLNLGAQKAKLQYGSGTGQSDKDREAALASFGLGTSAPDRALRQRLPDLVEQAYVEAKALFDQLPPEVQQQYTERGGLTPEDFKAQAMGLGGGGQAPTQGSVPKMTVEEYTRKYGRPPF